MSSINLKFSKKNLQNYKNIPTVCEFIFLVGKKKKSKLKKTKKNNRLYLLIFHVFMKNVR